MKFGLNTWSLLNSDIYSAVKTIGDAKLGFIELWGEVPHAYHDWVDKKRLRDALSVYEPTVTMHAPFTDLNPATPFEPVKSAVSKTLKDFVKFGNYLGAKRVTIHPGSVNSEALVPKSIENVVSTLHELLKQSDGALEINIENQVKSQSPYHFPLGSNFESIDVLLAEAEGVRLTLDTGHAHVNTIDPLELYQRFQREITEIHLSDNKGERDDHLAPGQGSARINGLLDEVGSSSIFLCLELNPHRFTSAEVMKAASDLSAKFG
ncbi:MAG: sugar phosphate isomerase/epimerase [Nitrososphaerales archaeon]|nr:sugar phosphate isomerase/epimerase [Nitrososphaerales archaeon]